MDEQPQLRIFDHLAIEDEAKAHLGMTARYAKYVGIITIVLAAIGFARFLYAMIRTGNFLGSLDYYFSFYGIIALFVQLLGIATYFAVGLFTIRFSNKIKSSIELLNQQDNDDAWRNLKMAYRICGILGILCVLFVLFVVVMAGLSF